MESAEPLTSLMSIKYEERMAAVLKAVRKHKTDLASAVAQLNEQNITTGSGKKWTQVALRAYLNSYGVKA